MSTALWAITVTDSIGGSKGVQGAYAPLGIQILSISRSFWENWQNHMVAPPPQGNPGSATGQIRSLTYYRSKKCKY